MEIYQLRYFIAVADAENLHRAAEKLRVSPPALSKAVKALEGDLGQPLFRRRGRNIELTAQGRALRDRAIALTDMADSIRADLGSTPARLELRIAGRDLLLSEFATPIEAAFEKMYPDGTTHLINVGGSEATALLGRGNVHLVISVAQGTDVLSKKLGAITAMTCVGQGHPLYRRARAGDAVPIEELLEYRFVSPSAPLVGTPRGGAIRAADGWREDMHPRRVGIVTVSALLYSQYAESNRFVSYLPDFWAKRMAVAPVKVTGCRFECSWNVYAQYRRVAGLDWVRKLI